MKKEEGKTSCSFYVKSALVRVQRRGATPTILIHGPCHYTLELHITAIGILDGSLVLQQALTLMSSSLFAFPIPIPPIVKSASSPFKRKVFDKLIYLYHVNQVQAATSSTTAVQPDSSPAKAEEISQ